MTAATRRGDPTPTPNPDPDPDPSPSPSPSPSSSPSSSSNPNPNPNPDPNQARRRFYVVPAVPARLLRFEGSWVHAVPKPTAELLGERESEAEEAGDAASVLRHVLPFFHHPATLHDRPATLRDGPATLRDGPCNRM